MKKNGYVQLKKHVFSFLLVGFLFLNVEGKAQDLIKTHKHNANTVEQWDEFIEENVSVPDKKLSNIVIYRAAELKGTAVNVFIDGEYHASLLPGAYTQAIVCPGVHRITMSYTNTVTRYREKQSKGESIMLQTGATSFYQVIDNFNKGLKIKPLSKNEAALVFKDKPYRQYHTISRLNKKECKQIVFPVKRKKIIKVKKKQEALPKCESPKFYMDKI